MDTPLFFYSDIATKVMSDIVMDLPAGIEVYMVGGVLCNALVRKYFGEIWTQRDYDQVATKNSGEYLNYLIEKGFDFRGIDEPNHKTASKPVVDNARYISYEDNLVFDIHLSDAMAIKDSLKHNSGLSINGLALNLRDVFADDWEDKLITLPGALDSIKNKQIRINYDGYQSDSSYFFALIRFMGLGFAGPTQEDIMKLLKTVSDLSAERYQKNIMKLVSYLGSEYKVRSVVNTLGIHGLDVFNENATRKLINELDLS